MAEGHAEGHARHQPLASLRMSLGYFTVGVLRTASTSQPLGLNVIVDSASHASLVAT